jgi:hypothetical protein
MQRPDIVDAVCLHACGAAAFPIRQGPCLQKLVPPAGIDQSAGTDENLYESLQYTKYKL